MRITRIPRIKELTLFGRHIVSARITIAGLLINHPRMLGSAAKVEEQSYLAFR